MTRTLVGAADEPPRRRPAPLGSIRPSEEACEDTIIRAARIHGWRVHAERKARSMKGVRTPIKGQRGYPDLTLAHGASGAVWFVELKRRPNKPEPDQVEWLNVLEGTTGATFIGDSPTRSIARRAFVVWVPEDMGAFIEDLALPFAEPRSWRSWWNVATR